MESTRNLDKSEDHFASLQVMVNNPSKTRIFNSMVYVQSGLSVEEDKINEPAFSSRKPKFILSQRGVPLLSIPRARAHYIQN